MEKTLIIDNETKQHISLILKYYRQQLHIKQYDFIQNAQHFICSADTYSRIENGKIIKRNSIYFNLLQKLHLNYSYDSVTWKKFQISFQTLLKYIYTYQIPLFCEKAQEIITDLQPIDDYLACEIVLFLKDAMEYYAHDMYLSEEQYQKYCFIYAIFPMPLQTILKSMLFQFISEIKRDYRKCHQLFQLLQLATSKEPLLQMAQAYEYMFEERYLESYAIACQLKLRFQKENNVHREVELYEILIHLYHIVQKGVNAIHIIDEYLCYYDAKYITMTPYTYAKALFLKSRILMNQNDMIQAQTHFFKLYQQQDTTYQLYAAIFLYYLKYTKKQDYIINKIIIHRSCSSPIMILYNYFLNKDKQTFEQQELYLTKHVLPAIQHVDPIFYTLVYDEILRLIKVTKHYYIKKKI